MKKLFLLLAYLFVLSFLFINVFRFGLVFEDVIINIDPKSYLFYTYGATFWFGVSMIWFIWVFKEFLVMFFRPFAEKRLNNLKKEIESINKRFKY